MVPKGNASILAAQLRDEGNTAREARVVLHQLFGRTLCEDELRQMIEDNYGQDEAATSGNKS